MNDFFSKIKNMVPEEDIPSGHRDRFSRKLDSLYNIRHRLLLIQRIAVAATVLIFIASVAFLTFRFENIRNHKKSIYQASSELYETETYLSSEIKGKFDHLVSNYDVEKQMIHDFREIDRSILEIKKDLAENPNDDRLVEAVIETYRLKSALLDDILQKKQESKI